MIGSHLNGSVACCPNSCVARRDAKLCTLTCALATGVRAIRRDSGDFRGVRSVFRGHSDIAAGRRRVVSGVLLGRESVIRPLLPYPTYLLHQAQQRSHQVMIENEFTTLASY